MSNYEVSIASACRARNDGVWVVRGEDRRGRIERSEKRKAKSAKLWCRCATEFK
ncbi:MAG: hypothetical protein JSV82_01710 [Planctomycetota bacterium]|nr:MAG: hypothetical protein JSV82_01710 [Planctomycetota bacterium]